VSGANLAELLDAVRAFLREDVLPELEGFKAYNTRVAANALGIVVRELELGPRLAELDNDMGAALGLDPGAGPFTVQIARGLRDGTLAVDDRLLGYLRRRTLLAIAIDNPKYSGLRQARERWGNSTDS
jgi:hypothetical protein